MTFCVLIAGCVQLPDTTPSPAFNAFSVTQMLSEGRFRVQELPGERTTNSATGRAQVIEHGIITSPASEFPCYRVYQLVKKCLDTAAGGSAHQEGWIPQAPEHPGGPVRITTFYNQGRRHGEMHLWLFPNADESQIHYALHLVEEPLR